MCVSVGGFSDGYSEVNIQDGSTHWGGWGVEGQKSGEDRRPDLSLHYYLTTPAQSEHFYAREKDTNDQKVDSCHMNLSAHALRDAFFRWMTL